MTAYPLGFLAAIFRSDSRFGRLPGQIVARFVVSRSCRLSGRTSTYERSRLGLQRGLVFVAVLVSGCGSSPGGVSSNRPLIENRIDDILGVSAAEVSNRIVARQANLITECMTSAGYAPRDDDAPRPPAPGDLPSEPDHLGRIVEEMIPTEDSKPDEPIVASDPKRYEALDMCYARAREEVVNPFGNFYEWWFTQTEDLQASIASDESTVKANAALQSCLSDLGYGGMTDVELRNSFIDRGVEILNRGDGGLSRATMIAELTALAVEEEAVASTANACIDDREEVVSAVRTKLEGEFIAQHEGELIEHLTTLRAEAEEYLASSVPGSASAITA